MTGIGRFTSMEDKERWELLSDSVCKAQRQVQVAERRKGFEDAASKVRELFDDKRDKSSEHCFDD